MRCRPRLSLSQSLSLSLSLSVCLSNNNTSLHPPPPSGEHLEHSARRRNQRVVIRHLRERNQRAYHLRLAHGHPMVGGERLEGEARLMLDPSRRLSEQPPDDGKEWLLHSGGQANWNNLAAGGDDRARGPALLLLLGAAQLVEGRRGGVRTRDHHRADLRTAGEGLDEAANLYQAIIVC